MKADNQQVTASSRNRLRALPQVEKVLSDERFAGLLSRVNRRLAARTVRQYLQETRERILAGEDVGFDPTELARRLEDEVRPRLTRAVNGLGVALHTGLGRAPLSRVAQEALADVSEHFSSLEIDLDTGRRGSRYRHLESLLCEITGAEAAHVVNNNCAATLLVLSTMAAGREVIVSRGQLIEIGGAFRIPDVMRQSGCRMVEVGTTNRTHLRDYAAAITPDTAALLRVHTSNYRITGFTKEVSLDELVALGREHNLPVIDDLGSGAFIDLSKYGLPKEPLVQESIATGVAVACFSGDKLIGACQSGIIVGRKEYVARMRKHPLTRALRLDKLSFAVLERTLELFLDEPRVIREHALMQILFKPVRQMQQEARSLVKRVSTGLLGKAQVTVRPGFSEIGGGSLATERLESRVVAVRPVGLSCDELARRMRRSKPPVFGRVENDEYVLDFRTIRRDEVPLVAQALLAAFDR
ncbi:MAG: L-seryl-tRNA(Sec) selenium transferase [candidate division WOR-3 bacterium]